MTHQSKHNRTLPLPIRRRAGHRRSRGILLLPAAALVLTLTLASTSCSSSPTPEAQPVVTNTEPVGNGLKTIGYALLGGAVVMVLGSMIKP